MTTQQIELATLLREWRAAQRPEDVFGVLDAPQEDALKRYYRRLVALVHPDHHQHDAASASEAFRLLQHWFAQAQALVSAGRYGATPRIAVRSPRAHYWSDAEPLAGDLCDLYAADSGEPVLLKVVRKPSNNDLLADEARRLRLLDRDLGGDRVRAHFPTLLDSFQIEDGSGARRQCNVLRHETGYVTLADVVAAYPAGIDAADMAWMFNRVLVALATTHRLGYVHGAVLPSHVLLRLDDHNGMLVDWCYSVPVGSALPAISPAYRAFYPPEVAARLPATPATDLYMAAMCMLHLLGGDVATQQLPAAVPAPITALLRACLLPAPARRLGDAWLAYDDFGTILRRLYGPPRFRPFTMPA